MVDTPQAGQIRKIKPLVGGELPPTILILEEVETCAAKVAQVSTVKTKYDVYVPGFGWAQPWNVYTMRLEDLSEPLGHNLSAADAVLKLEGIVSSSGDFQEEEIKIGSYYSFPSVMALMDDL